jgi:flagellar biosynthesis protein FlhG
MRRGTMFTGELLRRVREANGIELVEMTAITKFSQAHLVAIENEDDAGLPGIVSVRGFLGELAKFLRLDVALGQKTYSRRMRDAGSGRGGASS